MTKPVIGNDPELGEMAPAIFVPDNATAADKAEIERIEKANQQAIEATEQDDSLI